jgi:oligosaccharide repeat unit polymerase
VEEEKGRQMIYLFAVLFPFSFFIVYLCTDGWFSLARLHALLWTLLFIGYAIFGDAAPLGYAGIAWLLASFYILLLGEKLGQTVIKNHHDIIPDPLSAYKLPHKVADNIKPFIPWISWLLLIVFFVVAMLGNYMEMRMYGFGISQLFSPSKIVAMNAAIAADRYSSNPTSSSLVTFLTSFRYIGVVCSAFLLPLSRNKKEKVLCVLGILPVIMNVLIDNTKAGFIASFALAFIGLLLGFATLHHHDPKVTGKQYFFIILVVVVFMVSLFLFMVNRTGSFSAESLATVRKKFLVYAFDEVGVFDVWVSDYYSFGHYTFGAQTFLAPLSVLGIVTKAPGIYGYLPGFDTNVYTAYRGLISDYGFIGSLFFMGLHGFLGGLVTQNVRSGLHPVFSKTFYAAFAFFLFYGFIISPWTYSSLIFTFIAFCFFIFISDPETKQFI